MPEGAMYVRGRPVSYIHRLIRHVLILIPKKNEKTSWVDSVSVETRLLRKEGKTWISSKNHNAAQKVQEAQLHKVVFFRQRVAKKIDC